jgi:hypothetical protein
MEPRHEESRKKHPEPRKEERKRRFQIVRLEERIAPRCNPRNPNVSHHCFF